MIKIKDTQIAKVLLLFLSWRLGLFIFAYFAVILISRFGGRFPYYEEILISTNLPAWFWGFGNFDGVHYLNIAKGGYFAQYSQAFFPLYPLLIRLLAGGENYFLTAFFVSNAFFVAAMALFYKLLRLDYSSHLSLKTLVLMLSFPTAFYFGAVYNESLFLFLVLLSLLLMRKKMFLGAGIAAGLASATKIVGIFLLFVLVIEIYRELKSKKIGIRSFKFLKMLTGILVAPAGLIIYMSYLKLVFNDALYFLTAQPVFGASRSANSIVLLPQVIFRYFKMLTSVTVFSLPFMNALLELTFTILPLAVLVVAFKKIRLSYLVFVFGCLILPTLTGTLSSMPRYALMSFLIFPFIAEKSGKLFIYLALIFFILEVILMSLFIRGYWIA